MERILLKSKIHRATVTDANLNYEGSISVCPNIIDAAKLVEFEKVDIYNINNGERISTYVIKGKCEEVCLNGAAARQAQPGDKVIIASYVHVEESSLNSFKPTLVYVDEKNTIIEVK